MEYNLSIPEANQQAHIDIENDILVRKNGLFTFILRVHEGKIEDYILFEYVNAKAKYASVATVTIQKSTTTYTH